MPRINSDIPVPADSNIDLHRDSFIDLHVHSTASDGTLTPAEVTALAKKQGLSAYALTDHDTVSGIWEASRAAGPKGPEVIPGIEISCPWEGQEIHVLGLFLDPENTALLEALAALRREREARNDQILSRMVQDGFPICREDLTFGCPDTVITRAHFARALLQKGLVSSMEQAFNRYLGRGKPYFCQKKMMEPKTAIRLIRQAGGFPALAHPVQYKLGWQKTEELLSALTRMGLMGLEVYYSSHSQSDSLRLRDIGRRLGLLSTGGSDFHGANKPDIQLGRGYGSLRVSSLLLEDIRSRLGR